jgi:hypothetical protein
LFARKGIVLDDKRRTGFDNTSLYTAIEPANAQNPRPHLEPLAYIVVPQRARASKVPQERKKILRHLLSKMHASGLASVEINVDPKPEALI